MSQPTTITPAAAGTPIQRAAEVRRLNERAAPLRIVIDPSLKPGEWFVVRGLSAAERSVVDHVLSTGKAKA